MLVRSASCILKLPHRSHEVFRPGVEWEVQHEVWLRNAASFAAG